mmetsp:Transcript_11019/g.22050  ORF Transcript_11019/g.22050 Transcript_11019/m.22050 type:complete len:102 (-) Transcript_11019:419-724(-)
MKGEIGGGFLKQMSKVWGFIQRMLLSSKKHKQEKMPLPLTLIFRDQTTTSRPCSAKSKKKNNPRPYKHPSMLFPFSSFCASLLCVSSLTARAHVSFFRCGS